jgi:hypothetical protein
MNSTWTTGRTPGFCGVRAAAHGGGSVVRKRFTRWRDRVGVHASWLALACVLGACGDDADGGTDAGASAGPSRKLSVLSASDRVRLCDAYIARLDDRFTRPEYERLACTKQAAPVSFQIDQSSMLRGNAELCQRFVGDCIQNGGAIGEDPPALTLGADLVDADSCKSGDWFQSCDLTTADFERCTDVLAREIQESLSVASCNALADAETIEDAFGRAVDPAALPECEAFTTQCPGLAYDTNVDGLK